MLGKLKQTSGGELSREHLSLVHRERAWGLNFSKTIISSISFILKLASSNFYSISFR